MAGRPSRARRHADGQATTRPVHPVRQSPTWLAIVVERETASEWLRLTVDPRTDEIFSWERVFLP